MFLVRKSGKCCKFFMTFVSIPAGILIAMKTDKELDEEVVWLSKGDFV